ncbi:mCG1027459, isoform CRA_b [Mus musculus]|nr:mCG1027459, isoform CRA_b [Mus musculus]
MAIKMTEYRCQNKMSCSQRNNHNKNNSSQKNSPTLPRAEFRKRPQTILTLLEFPVTLIAVTLITDL